jgi:hypothetical protein
MNEDSVLREVRVARESCAASHGFDVRKTAADPQNHEEIRHEAFDEFLAEHKTQNLLTAINASGPRSRSC